MRIALLHLSDLHITAPSQTPLTRVAQIAAVFNELPDRVDVCVVTITGDLAFAGSAADYDLAARFVEDLVAALRRNDRIARVEVALVPGNHDCDLSANEVRDICIEKVRQDASVEPGAGVVTTCVAVQDEFFRFMARVDGRPVVNDALTRLHYVRDIELGDHRLRFDCYNTAWLSVLHEEQGRLSMPVPRGEQQGLPATITIAILHHPFGWLEPQNGRALRERLQTTSDLILTGHEHAQGYYQRRTLTDSAEYYEAGALQPHGGDERSEFTVVLVDAEARQHHLSRYEWKDGLYRRTQDGKWLSLFRATTRLEDKFVTTGAFEELLNELSVSIYHPRRSTLRLEDLFVYPNLREIDPSKAARGPSRITTGSVVPQVLLGNARILVHGDESSGKTSLAKTLWREAARRGLVPLYVPYTAIKGSREDAFREMIAECVSSQYGRHESERYGQLPRAKRIAIIDDLHRYETAPEARSEFLRLVSNYFGATVAFADEAFRIEELTTSAHGANELLKFRHFSILETGREQKERIIAKWRALGREFPERAEDASRAVFLIRREIDGILKKNILPSYPFFLLLLLQQIELKKQESVTGSQGYLYEVIITRALSSGSSEEIDARYNYLSELAFLLFSRNVKAIATEEFERVHAEYTKKYDYYTPWHSTVTALVRANILVERDALYRFKYEYFYCYFVARYLSRAPAARRDVMPLLLATIYREEHANILIFLSYLSKNDLDILSQLLQHAKRQYAGVTPVDFEKTLHILGGGELHKAPLALPEDHGPESRSRLLAQIDEAEQSRDAEFVSEAGAEAKAVAEEVKRANVAIKTVQVIGQILRSFPGSIVGDTKFQLAEECYLLGLRLVGDLFAMLEQRGEPIVAEVTRVLREEQSATGDVAIRAREFVAALSELCSLGVIKHLASSLGAESLSKTYERVLSNKPTVAVRLIDASIKLDFFATFPEMEVRDLAKRTAKLGLARGILRSLVYEHFYLYPPRDYKMLQSVCRLLNIYVKNTRANRLLSQ